MVNIVLPSLSVSIDAGNANVLEKIVSPIASDAVITVRNAPADPTHSYTLLSFLQSIEFRNYNSTSDDNIRFRISVTNYGLFAQYMSDIFTPAWSKTDAGVVDNTNDAMIRATLNNAGDTITNTMTLLVEQGNVSAPGNFHDSEHGSIPDVHIGYMAAALTNAHEGRAVILNEENVFNTMNGSFGTDFISSLWSTTSGESASLDSGGQYYQIDFNEDTDGPLKDLFSALYHNAAERFQTDPMNDTEEFQPLPLESGDTMSIKLIVSGNMIMSTLSLANPQTDGNDIIPLIIPSHSKANPSTYLSPFNVEESVAPESASDTAVANGVQDVNYSAGVSHNGVNAVSLQIRPQKYEFKMVLGNSNENVEPEPEPEPEPETEPEEVPVQVQATDQETEPEEVQVPVQETEPEEVQVPVQEQDGRDGFIAGGVDSPSALGNLVSIQVIDADGVVVNYNTTQQQQNIIKLIDPNNSDLYFTISPGRNELNVFQNNKGWGISDANMASGLPTLTRVEFAYNQLKNTAGFEALRIVNEVIRFKTNEAYGNLSNSVFAPDAPEQSLLQGFVVTLDNYEFSDKTELKSAIDLWISDQNSALATYGHINTWDTSAVTDFGYLFMNESAFNSDISNWDVSNATTFEQCFSGCSAFNQDISGWDVSNATVFNYMFNGASSFNQNISEWNVGTTVTVGHSQNSMFRDATSFNQDLSGWLNNENKSHDIRNMFNGATAFLNQYPNGPDGWGNPPTAVALQYTNWLG